MVWGDELREALLESCRKFIILKVLQMCLSIEAFIVSALRRALGLTLPQMEIKVDSKKLIIKASQ